MVTNILMLAMCTQYVGFCYKNYLGCRAPRFNTGYPVTLQPGQQQISVEINYATCNIWDIPVLKMDS